MTENPHYDSDPSLHEENKAEESIEKAASTSLTVIPPEYNVISSSSLWTIKDLGEGAFGKVHLAEYTTSAEDIPEKHLVAVRIIDKRKKSKKAYNTISWPLT